MGDKKTSQLFDVVVTFTEIDRDNWLIESVFKSCVETGGMFMTFYNPDGRVSISNKDALVVEETRVGVYDHETKTVYRDDDKKDAEIK